ncbi:hypothetical protein IWZ01DRAFT_333631 [Phyllosticta capitalensis]
MPFSRFLAAAIYLIPWEICFWNAPCRAGWMGWDGMRRDVCERLVGHQQPTTVRTTTSTAALCRGQHGTATFQFLEWTARQRRGAVNGREGVGRGEGRERWAAGGVSTRSLSFCAQHLLGILPLYHFTGGEGEKEKARRWDGMA